MPSTVQTTDHTVSLLFAAASALGVTALGLLIAGTWGDRHALLAWGVVAGMVCVGVSCMVAMRWMIDDAVNRCVIRVHTSVGGHVEGAVNDTAVKVGRAIAEGLADDIEVPRPRAGVLSIY